MAAITQAPDQHGGEEKNLTLLEHLQELRHRLMISAVALVIGMCVSFYPLTGWVLKWIQEPARNQVEDFNLIFTQPLEYWTTYFQVSLMLGTDPGDASNSLAVACFHRPRPDDEREALGLPDHRRLQLHVHSRLRFRLLRRAAARAGFPARHRRIARSVHLGAEVRWLRDEDDDRQRPRLSGADGRHGPRKLGIVTSRKLFRWWRFAIVGAFIISAVVTPSIDPVTQTLVAGPMIVLYFLGIGLAKLVEGKPIIPPA